MQNIKVMCLMTFLCRLVTRLIDDYETGCYKQKSMTMINKVFDKGWRRETKCSCVR